MYSVVSTALQMRFEFQKCATFDVFAFPAGSVCFHIKYFWIRQVELVCLQLAVFKVQFYIYIILSAAYCKAPKKKLHCSSTEKFFVQSEVQQRNLNVSSSELLAYILDRKWLHYFDQSIAGLSYCIDNISDCILWFVERFILIKSSVDTCCGIHK